MDDPKLEFEEITRAAERLRPYLDQPTPVRQYPSLNRLIGNDISVYVKHENHLPTNSFKFRNGIAAITALSEEERKRGVVAATAGNHGQGVALAGQMLGVQTIICVQKNNNPDKNRAIRDYGATLIEEGKDYDEAVEVAKRLRDQKNMIMIHSVNRREVVAGAGTISLEFLQQHPELDALVLSVGGGTHAVGACIVAKRLKPTLEIYGVQAAGAPANHDAWHSKSPKPGTKADTFADGVRTRGIYEMTYIPLQNGIKDFLTVTEVEISEAVKAYIEHTHNLVEGAAAVGLAGLIKIGDRLKGKRVGLVLTGANIDLQTLQRVLSNQIR